MIDLSSFSSMSCASFLSFAGILCTSLCAHSLFLKSDSILAVALILPFIVIIFLYLLYGGSAVLFSCGSQEFYLGTDDLVLQLIQTFSDTIKSSAQKLFWVWVCSLPLLIVELIISIAGQNIRKLVKDGFIIRKPTKIHSRSRARRALEAKRKGRHSGYGNNFI